jgi:hypothetical protein
MILRADKRSTGREMSPSATFSTTYLGLNLSLHGETVATNSPNHGTASFVLCSIISVFLLLGKY